ncbi:MAG: DUF5683 domain-containing protein [Candidatus Hatepunaea meridiana]|nr:DUF5683 domain-containing protein [Candidatus Hatepunaea meridiana]
MYRCILIGFSAFIVLGFHTVSQAWDKSDYRVLDCSYGCLNNDSQLDSKSTFLALNKEVENLNWRPSPTGAALRSLVLPGWGQIYVKQPLKAVIYAGIQQGFMYGIYRQHNLYKYHSARDEDGIADFYHNDRNRMGWYLTAAILMSVMDAYVEAHLYKFDVSDKLTIMDEGNGFLDSGIQINFFWRLP